MKKAWTSVCALALLQPSLAQAQALDSCYDVIVAMRDAGDCQNTELYRELYWPGASIRGVDGSTSLYDDARLNGPCPKYRTYLRDIDIGPVVGSRQSIRFKSIVTRVDFDGRYSGDYTVWKKKATCEQRDGEWRVVSSINFSRNDFVNEDAVNEFRRSGGYDGDPETKL